MYYIMLKFPSLYVRLKKIIKDNFKSFEEKNLVGKKTGKSREFQIA